MSSGRCAEPKAEAARSSSHRSGRGRGRKWTTGRKNSLGKVPCLGLSVLRKGQHHRSAFGRVQEHSQGLRQGLEQLSGFSDAVPIADDSAEGVVGSDRGRPRVLDLLQDGVRNTAGVSVAGQEQQGSRSAMATPRR